jgi:hypothetical protein
MEFKDYNFLALEDMQPPWNGKDTQPWSGFCELYKQMCGATSGAWDARGLFQLLLGQLSPEKAAELYDDWRVKRDEAATQTGYEKTEEELLADLSITTNYARYLITSRRTDFKTSDSIDNLKRKSEELLTDLTSLVAEVDDLGNKEMRPTLESRLAILEERALVASQHSDAMFENLEADSIWKAAGENLDLVTLADFLRISYAHIKQKSMALHSKLGDKLRQVLLDQMGDMIGYHMVLTTLILQAITSRLEDSDLDVRRSALEALGERTTLPENIHQAIISRLENSDRGVRRSAIEVLGKQTTLSENILQAITSRLEHRDLDVRRSAIVALGKHLHSLSLI